VLLKVWLYFGLTAIGTLIVGEQMLPLVRADRAARDRGLRVRALPAVPPLAHVLLPLWWSSPADMDALGNVTECWPARSSPASSSVSPGRGAKRGLRVAARWLIEAKDAMRAPRAGAIDGR